MESTTTQGNEMTKLYQIRLNVRGASNESYARVALQVARGDGINAERVVRITRTAKGAVVTVEAVAA